MQAKAQDDVVDREVAPCRDVGERASERARGGNAGARRGGLRAGGLGEEEGDHAVADVPTDEAARVDDALIGGAREAPPEREVAGRRQATGERGRRLQVREQDRRRASRRLRDVLHALEVPRIDAGRDRREHRHAGFGLHDQRGAGVPPRGVVDAHRRDEVGHGCADVHPVRREPNVPAPGPRAGAGRRGRGALGGRARAVRRGLPPFRRGWIRRARANISRTWSRVFGPLRHCSRTSTASGPK